METCTIPYLNDLHVHLRDLDVAAHFARLSLAYSQHILAMPNTNPPLNTVERWARYYQHVTADQGINPSRILVALKLTGETDREMIKAFALRGGRVCKLYPAGVTTNSHDGVRLDTPHDLQALYPTLAAMQDAGVILSIHGEHPGSFCLAREEAFVFNFLAPLLADFPQLRVVLEHISTGVAADFVRRSAYRDRLAATITAHHLLLTLDDVIGDTLQPNNFCKPVAKYDSDRARLLTAATGGETCFFLGSDSAPHTHAAKYNCGCAGCFTAPYLPELLATIFEAAGQLESLAAFASHNGAKFYKLPQSTQTITLQKVAGYQPTKLHDPQPDSNQFYDIFNHPRHPLTWARVSPEQVI